jgi:hypothetical protein
MMNLQQLAQIVQQREAKQGVQDNSSALSMPKAAMQNVQSASPQDAQAADQAIGSAIKGFLPTSSDEANKVLQKAGFGMPDVQAATPQSALSGFTNNLASNMDNSMAGKLVNGLAGNKAGAGFMQQGLDMAGNGLSSLLSFFI